MISPQEIRKTVYIYTIKMHLEMRVSEYMYKKVLIKKNMQLLFLFCTQKAKKYKKKIKCNKATCRNILSFFILMFIQLCNLYATEFL